MKIVSWNCNGAFRNKAKLLDQFNADILIIQECEDPSRSSKIYNEWAGSYLWIGDSKNKGLGIFARNGNQVQKLNWKGEIDLSFNKLNGKSISIKNDYLKYFTPCLINNEFHMLGIWATKSIFENFEYIGQIWLYLQIHKEKLKNQKQIICGDFNSNSIWDKWDRFWNHSDVVNELRKRQIESLYHYKSGEKYGNETNYTFYMYRKLDKPYHIDYIFLSNDLLVKSIIDFPNPTKWLKYSDHIPIVCEVNA